MARKPLYPSGKMERYQIVLDPKSHAAALKLGDGNLSLGIRLALARPVKTGGSK